MRITIIEIDDYDVIPQPTTIPWNTGTVPWQRPVVDPCANCPNHPRNNPLASGICNCAIPAMANPVICSTNLVT